MAGNILENGLQKEKTNVLFDINSNRVFTITDFAKNILDMSDGESNLSEIIDTIKERYKMPYDEAESKCKNFLQGLIDKNIIIKAK